MPPLSVVILAAGQGKRMKSELPKVLQPLAGQPLLRHVLRAARKLDPAEIYIVYGHGGDEIRKAFANEHVNWILQAEQLGTGHAALQAIQVIPDHHIALVLFGDVPLIAPERLAALVAAAQDGLALITIELDDATGYGRILRGAGGRVTRIVEHRDASPQELVIREAFSGLLAAPAGRLRHWLSGITADNSQREYYLTDVVTGAVASGDAITCVAVPTVLEVLGVNDKIQLAQVEAGYRKLRVEQLMLAGATLIDPSRVDLRGDVTVESDVSIDVNTIFLGRVHLASRVRIGPNCVIRDALIGSDTEIFASCVIEEAEVAARCRVGPFARLRPGAVLGEGVHIGNFVEVKNSTLGEGSKANHLSYLGDARVGRDVNIGAGTITCNYDGVNKWPTLIEDDAFIGSGSMLVAPVRVGAAATIGAGSTITQSAADGKLTLERSRQITVDGWERPPRLAAQDRDAAVAGALAPPADESAKAPGNKK